MPAADADLERFVQAQVRTYAQALDELERGRKASHWMWFIFPQLRGLGFSQMSYTYGIAGLAEAVAYQAHPVLGPRLIECTEAMLAHAGTTADAILGHVDALKFRSCMTLFAHAAPGVPACARALQQFFDGQGDAQTLRLLNGA